MGSTRYNIIQMQVDHPGQIISFQHKIPSYLKRCTGFIAKHVKGVQTENFIPEIGWITASFNSLKEEALVAPISAQPSSEPAEAYGYQSLDVALKPSQLVIGVYVDSMKSITFPYVISLYLRCVPTVRIHEPSSKSTNRVSTLIDVNVNQEG